VKVHFNVAPRFTPGSPAMVDGPTAYAVASEERLAYERSLTGVYGEQAKTLAEHVGCVGIVERREERSDCWIVLDVITQHQFIRPFPSQHAVESEKKQRARAFRLRSKYGLLLEGERIS
jgi:hypothetical protein